MKTRALWPPNEEQAAKLGPPPPCLACGGPTYWDETWDGVFMAWCADDTLAYSTYAYISEDLKIIHKRRRARQYRQGNKQQGGLRNDSRSLDKLSK